MGKGIDILRKGNPLSTLLFVMVMEYFSRVMNKMAQLPDFRFHSMCKSLGLTHLIFVDDLMIFCKGNKTSINRVMEAPQHFTNTTGLVANLDKSNIFIVGVDEETRNRLITRTSFVAGVFPMRYLGLPLSPKKWNKLDCMQLIDKITAKIKASSATHLSYVG